MSEYTYPPFAADGSREALRNLVLDVLDEPTPSTIVVDDPSARIPSLVLRRALQEKCAITGDPPPNHYFISGRAANAAPIDDYCFRYDGPLLIFTDTIYSGRTILEIMKKIHGAGIAYDKQTVASIGTEPHGRTNLDRAPHPVRLLSGSDGERFGHDFRNSGRYSGVERGTGALHTHRRFDIRTSSEAVRRARTEACALGRGIFTAWLHEQSTSEK